MTATLDQVYAAITLASRKLDTLLQEAGIIMSQQDDINADVQAIEAGVTALGDAATAIQAEIAALKAANPALDLTGLDKAAADMAGAVAGITSIAAPPAA